MIHVWNGLDHPSHCSPKKCIPIGFNVIFCKAHPSPIGMCTNPSRDRDGSILPTLMPNLIMYQNTCFAIQASLYSTLEQKWDGSPDRVPAHHRSSLKLSHKFLSILPKFTQCSQRIFAWQETRIKQTLQTLVGTCGPVHPGF